LATYFVSSEPTSGQFLVYGHGVFSKCTHYGILYCLQTIFIFKFKLKFKLKTLLANAGLT